MIIPRILSAAVDMDSVMNNGMTIPERLSLGLETMLIGLGTVFGVLIIIMGILYLFQFIFYTLPNRKKNQDTKENTISPVEAEPSPEKDIVESDDELIAAISAAVAVCIDKPTSAFRVVSFKRTNINK